LVNGVQAFNNTSLKYALSLLTSTLRHRYSIATVFILRCKGIDKAFILRSKGMDGVLLKYGKVITTASVRRPGGRAAEAR
jgi:coenzyme F420-reducing hydrogenase delta subunit